MQLIISVPKGGRKRCIKPTKLYNVPMFNHCTGGYNVVTVTFFKQMKILKVLAAHNITDVEVLELEEDKDNENT